MFRGKFIIFTETFSYSDEIWLYLEETFSHSKEVLYSVNFLVFEKIFIFKEMLICSLNFLLYSEKFIIFRKNFVFKEIFIFRGIFMFKIFTFWEMLIFKRKYVYSEKTPNLHTRESLNGLQYLKVTNCESRQHLEPLENLFNVFYQDLIVNLNHQILMLQYLEAQFRSSHPEVFRCGLFLPASGLQLYHKDTLAQVFSCKFCKTSKNTFSYRTPPVAASVYLKEMERKPSFIVIY